MSDVNCMKTRVRNISSQKMSFGYLKHIGIWHALRSGEEKTGNGDLVAALTDRPVEYAKFLTDLQAGRLVLLDQPAQHYYDAENDTVQILRIVDGTLRIDEPCWGHYVSSGGVDDGGN